MSLEKCEEVLCKAIAARDAGQESLHLTTDSLIRLLKYIQGLHYTLREIQIDLLPSTLASDRARMFKAVCASLDRIEDVFGPLDTLFDEMSDTSEVGKSE